MKILGDTIVMICISTETGGRKALHYMGQVIKKGRDMLGLKRSRLLNISLMVATLTIIWSFRKIDYPNPEFPTLDNEKTKLAFKVAAVQNTQCPSDALQIHAFVTHYRKLSWLDVNIHNLINLADKPDCLLITVLTMEPTRYERDQVHKVIDSRADLVFPSCTGPGGMPLLCLFETSAVLTRAPITIMIDVDAILMRPSWDSVIRTVFQDDNVGVAAINPRGGKAHESPVFLDRTNFFNNTKACFWNTVEWNWLSYRTELLKTIIIKDPTPHSYCDHGHYFAKLAIDRGSLIYRFPRMMQPFPNKSPVISEYGGNAFVYHNFYATRKQEDPLPGSEAKFVTSNMLEECVLKWLKSINDVLGERDIGHPCSAYE